MKIVALLSEDVDLTTLLEGLLQARDYRVLTARTSEECLSLLRDHDIDLLILDLDNQRSNSIKLYRRFRTMESYRDVPLIALSCRDKMEFVSQLDLSRLLHYIIKPLDPEDLVSRIDEFMVSRSLDPSAILRILQKISDADEDLLRSQIQGFRHEHYQAFRTDYSKIDLAVVVPKETPL